MPPNTITAELLLCIIIATDYKCLRIHTKCHRTIVQPKSAILECNRMHDLSNSEKNIENATFVFLTILKPQTPFKPKTRLAKFQKKTLKTRHLTFVF